MINNSLKALIILAICFTTSALAQTPTPTPTATPAVTRPTTPTQTLASLQDKIRQRLLRPEVRRGRVGIKIVSLNSGTLIFENDADKYFMPASNMKNFTVATAIERLSPILMTALATGLALVPLVIGGDVPGHEIEYPMAIVILGGLITSTVLNLFVVPSLYLRFGKRKSAVEADWLADRQRQVVA